MPGFRQAMVRISDTVLHAWSPLGYWRRLLNPQPVYHAEGKSNTGGTTIVTLTVLADGTPENPQVIESGGNEIDQAVLKAIKDSKFEPARCEKDALIADFQYQFTYNGSPLLPSF